MKKLISLFLLSSLLLTACGNTNTVTIEPQEPTQEVSGNETEEETVSEEVVSECETEPADIADTAEEKDIEIIMRYISFDDTPIEDYVEKLNTEEENEKYFVYNDEYYSFYVSESESNKTLEYFDDSQELNDGIEAFFNEECIAGIFTSIKYDDNFTNFELYADCEKYNENSFQAIISSSLFVAAMSNLYQAYAQVPIDERECFFIIYDNETNDVLYDSTDN